MVNITALFGWAIILFVLVLIGLMSKGWAVGLWFVGLVLIVIEAAVKSQQAEEEAATKRCDMCAETIHADAKKCKHCGEMQAG